MVYKFEADKFIMNDYSEESPFSGFLPGLAGVDGIPMWVYYVNRGQGIASFGIGNKNNAIMEFAPANIKYRTVGYDGFRTFIKIDNKVFEPYCCFKEQINSKIHVGMNTLAVECEVESLRIKAEYFILPNESFPALVRRLSIENLSDKELDIELLDGMPSIIPCGIENNVYREISNTLMAWMDVYNTDKKIPFYKVRASTKDTSEISNCNEGYFYLSFMEEGELLPIIADGSIIFGTDTSLSRPLNFEINSIDNLIQKRQITVNKVPCGFTAAQTNIKSKEVKQLTSYIGFVKDFEEINARASDITSTNYVNSKYEEAQNLVQKLTDKVQTKTCDSVFDLYARQCYMDNVLRGGEPIVFKNKYKDLVYHVFSRRHGDLERDYNSFALSAEPYSQGNGNFRDVNQNRRCDIVFNPNVGDFNINMFMSLIQADGYNPLSVEGCYFTVDKNFCESIAKDNKALTEFLKSPFTPGSLSLFIEDNSISSELFYDILYEAKQHISAQPKESYWIDHFTYNLDMIETYLSIFPDKYNELFFESKNYKYYDSHHLVRPRHQKYVLTQNGVRQYNSVEESKQKLKEIDKRITEKNWLRAGEEVYYTNLFEKLLVLGVNKASLLDPYGIGIEMEADRPGWNDSMNGLPGLIGSGVSETFETLRLLRFIQNLCMENLDRGIKLPKEAVDFLISIADIYADSNLNDFDCWDKISTVRENYRDSIKYGFAGRSNEVFLKDINKYLDILVSKFENGAKKAFEISEICPAYLYYNAVEYEVLANTDNAGRPYVKAKKFERHVLPSYLESPTRAMKILDKDDAQNLYEAIKASNLYDRKLGMYKTNTSLAGETFEIGRSRAFTPGWLENEAVFLHMEYKYLLEILKKELYDEFFTDIKTVLIPFLKPESYGRSTLENSSFIVSSENPDDTIHGKGFVSRLSGSTAEFLNMWFIMMAGKKPFDIDENGKLVLSLNPILPEWLFDKHNEISFNFLGRCIVTYVNKSRINTYNGKIESITVIFEDDAKVLINGSVISEEYAKKVRNGEVKEIICEY